MVAAKRGFRNLLQVFSFLKHVLNRRLINHKVRLTVLAIDLDAIAVIPLDDSVDLLVIAQNCPSGAIKLLDENGAQVELF